MAKKEKTVYSPGELDQVRNRLGNIDNGEAQRIAQILGGEVGVERGEEKPLPIQRKKGRGGKSLPKPRTVTNINKKNDDGIGKKNSTAKTDPMDNPVIPIKLTYREWVKMDIYAGQKEFDIKSLGQVVFSFFSFFSPPPDYINPIFVTKRMNEYYKHLEKLVLSTRILFPRNNIQRNDRMSKSSAFSYAVLDTIRQWDIERIGEDLTRLQANPRKVKAADFSDILRVFYRPLFILEKLNLEQHILEVYKLVYKFDYIENPQETKDKNYQDLIQNAITSLRFIRKDIRFLLYPLLMKLLSDRWFSYDKFFIARKNRYLDFIGASDADQIQPIDMSKLIKNIEENQQDQEGIKEGDGGTTEESIQRGAEQEKFKAIDAEQKAVDKGLKILEVLFPKAGWDRLPQYPDLYPYFQDVFSLKKTYALIAPTDPVLQVAVFAYILRELLFGLRYVSFGVVTGPNRNPDRINELLDPIINNWYYLVENSFEREYLPRLGEYCRILENTSESRTSSYARRLVNELHWIKRLYFLPYYKFETILSSPFQKQDISSLYTEIRHLRKALTIIAAGIDRGNKMGGAEKKVRCDGINNPWDPYEFQVSNPLSRRLDLLLKEKNRDNAALIFFTLAVTVVADNFINNDGSWAYTSQQGPLFRSVKGEGVIPSPGVDEKVDSTAIFKQSLKREG